MFRRVLQPTYRQLTRSCLISQQLAKSAPANGQRRHFVKKIFKDKKTRSIFLLSFSAGLALISYNEYRKRDAKPSTAKIKSTNKNWNSTQRTINDSLDQDSLVGSYVSDAILDNLKIQKKVDGKNALPGKRLILLQYRNCPFCCKVKTFLDYYGIPHEIVEVNPLTRKQIKFSNYRKVPILLIEDEKLRKESKQLIQLNDSSSIISVLGTYLFCNPKQKDSLESIINKYESLHYTTLDENSKQVKEITNKYFLLYGESLSEKEFKSIENELLNERKWRKWTDEVFVHVLSPNIYRTTAEAVQAFNYFSEVSDWERTFSSFERLSVIYIGSFAMYLLSKHLKKKYQLKDDVRESLYDSTNYFLRARGGAEFIGGLKPNLSDLSIYGALSSIEGCDAFKDLTANTRISAWYFKMKRLVEEHRGGDLLKL